MNWNLFETSKKSYTWHYDSPLGGITLASNGRSLTGLWFDGQKDFGSTIMPKNEQKNLPVFRETCKWLDLYFGGEIPDFTPPLTFNTTVFRKAVWTALLKIPYGTTVSYKELAEQIEKDENVKHVSARPIGGAVAMNPISLIVPCHRVIGSNGSLTGYAGGLERKAKLLQLEKATIKRQ